MTDFTLPPSGWQEIDDYDPWTDPYYLADQIQSNLEYGELEYKVVTVLGGYPILIRGDRIAEAEEVDDLFDAIKANQAALPGNTRTLFYRQIKRREERRQQAAEERKAKKERGPTPKFGFVYMIGEPERPFESNRGIKIGWSTHPMRRALELQGRAAWSIGKPSLFVLHAIPSTRAPQAERLLHKHFAHLRRGNTEWFDLAPEHYEWFRSEALTYVQERGAA